MGAHALRTGSITGAVLCNDQTRVITVGNDKRITFWDCRTKEPTGIAL